MIATKFLAFLNKQYGWNIATDYYADIDTWREWWQGFVPAFHEYNETSLTGLKVKRRIYQMGMAKTICEDWAALLLNEKTMISVKDKASKKWLCGNDDETGGVLGELNFWDNANHLAELMMRSGTGAFLMSVDAVTEDGEVIPSPDARIYMDYLPAENIIPITVNHGNVTECAFMSEKVHQGKSCIYLQVHQLTQENGFPEYRITNRYYVGENEDTEAANYREVALPQGMSRVFYTGSDIPWFSLIRPNIVKNRRYGVGLGIAVYANALDQLMHVDTAFNNYQKDIHLGAKKVFYSKRLVQRVYGTDDQWHTIAPDDVMQQLFWQDDTADPDKEAKVTDYNPSLRAEENSKCVQDALNYLSFKCGLGIHRYNFNGGTVTTATEYTGSRQDLVQHANKHQISIEHGLIAIVRALLYAGRTFTGAQVDPETEITVVWDNTYISDAESARAKEKEDCLDGFLPKWKYLTDFYGMSEKEAREYVSEAEGSGEQISFEE